MFRRHENNVVGSLVGDGDVREIERLGIDLAISRIRKEFAEGVTVHIGMGEDGFVKIPARARVVVVVGKHTDLSIREKWNKPEHPDDQATAHDAASTIAG